VLHPHHALLAAARAFATTDAFNHTYRRHRPMVERSIAWLVRGANRRLRYRGTARNRRWLATASPPSTSTGSSTSASPTGPSAGPSPDHPSGPRACQGGATLRPEGHLRGRLNPQAPALRSDMTRGPHPPYAPREHGALLSILPVRPASDRRGAHVGG
jgi:hypothetical protein